MASSVSVSAEKTPAQLLAEQHAAHHATVEDTVDQDDIEHPPPSQPATATAPATNGTNGPLSAKAAGKQKEKPSVLDTQDEEAFPSLGGPSKPATTKAPGWGSKGTFKSAASPPLSSGASSPARPSSRGPGVGAVSLPNTNRDHFDIMKDDINKAAPLDKVLADAKRKYRVNTGVQEIAGGKERRFYAEGPQKAQVRQALLDISKAISIEKDIKIPVPASVTSSIIGRAGANIKKWEQQHGVRINIERDPRPASNDPSDPRTDVVAVRGDAASVREVNYKVNEMVKQNAPKVTMPLKHIAPEYYPFLAGRHAEEVQKLQQENDLNIHIPHYHTWQAQPPQRPAPGARPSFIPRGDSHVVLSGDQDAVMQAKLAVDALIQQLEQELMLEELTCEQVLHPYIVGDRGMDPLEFLQQTGCAIVLPPGHEETDELHIIGPQDRLDDGRNLAEQLMAQKYNRPVDLTKQYANAPMGPERHSRALAKYLQRKALEREFMQAHNSEIVFPVHPNATPTWSVISNDQQKAVSAKNDLMKITQAFPTSRIQLVEVDPFYHPHMEDMFSQQLQDDHGVMMIVPDDPEEPVILVYEGPAPQGPFTFPRQRPTSPEQKEFEQALKAAHDFLMSGIPSQEIAVSEIPVPRKHHDRLRRFVRNEQQTVPGSFPVQIQFGERRGQQPKAEKTPENVSLRGPSAADIAELQAKIEAFLLQAEQDDKERDYITTCDFPEKFVKNLVGKNGANIKALREKHDVEIDTRETGKVKIQGPKQKAEACKSEIIKLGKQYEDEVSYTIKVDPKFHGELIGKSGENLSKLQNKVNKEVRIDFPRTTRSGDVSDNASEVGGPNQRQAADEIRIRGPRAKADKVRDELLSLTQYLQDNSHVATVSVHKDQIKSLIGRGGAELERLRGETGALIDVPNQPEGDRVTITIKGPKASVDKARQEIASRSKAFDSIVTKTLTVDRKYHRDLIGSKGANIQKIVNAAGGPQRSAEAVQFPKQGEESSILTIRGTPEVVDKIVASIKTFVEDREGQVTEVVDVPLEQHRLIIGAAGNIRKSIEQRFNVALDIPSRESGKTNVKITGRPETVAQCKDHIVKVTKLPEGSTVMVPRSVHHAVSNNGRFFRDLSRQGIKVDHKGQQPPKKPDAASGVTRRTNNAAAPLITDEPSDAAAFSFEIIPLTNGNEDETGDIPWVLMGGRDVSEEAIAKAQRQIEEAIETAQEPRHIGYLRLADPKYHRHVIGSRGATINNIRRQTGCDIQVPGGQKSQNEGEEITIVGAEDMIQLARDLILEEVGKASD